MIRDARIALVVGATIIVAAGVVVFSAGDRVSRSPSRPAAAEASSTVRAPRTLPDSIVVRVTRADQLDAVAAYLTSHQYRILDRAAQPPAIQVAPPAGVTILHAITELTGHAGVLYAEPAYRLRASDLPTDPLFLRQAVYLNPVRAPDTWDIEAGDPSVIVAILDTGIDVTHPDLQGRVWTNTREVPNNGIDDDGNGCVDDVHGCAFVQDAEAGCGSPVNGDVGDDLGHGTFVSGIVAADGNGTGMVGVARNVTIMPVKVLDCTGGGSTFSLAQGILYAVNNGARVMNVSLGGPVDSAYVREAIRIARDGYGALLVAATGNGGGEVQYPARYANVLAVGAATASNPDARAPFSASGPEVDVVAIGEGVVGTVPRGTCSSFLPCIPGEDLYAQGDGTSFAAPQVTGLVALMLSRYHDLKPDQIVALIKSSADPVPPGDRPGWAGAGRVNMLRAIRPQFRIGAPGTTRG